MSPPLHHSTPLHGCCPKRRRPRHATPRHHTALRCAALRSTMTHQPIRTTRGAHPAPQLRLQLRRPCRHRNVREVTLVRIRSPVSDLSLSLQFSSLILRNTHFRTSGRTYHKLIATASGLGKFGADLVATDNIALSKACNSYWVLRTPAPVLVTLSDDRCARSLSPSTSSLQPQRDGRSSTRIQSTEREPQQCSRTYRCQPVVQVPARGRLPQARPRSAIHRRPGQAS